jgi:hypothetical protein
MILTLLSGLALASVSPASTAQCDGKPFTLKKPATAPQPGAVTSTPKQVTKQGTKPATDKHKHAFGCTHAGHKHGG